MGLLNRAMTLLRAQSRAEPRTRKKVRLAGRSFMIWGAMGSSMLFFTFWTFYPFVYTFFRSFFDWHPLRTGYPFVGLGNYREVLWVDTLFWKSMYNTVYFSLANVGIGTFLCLGVAVMVNSVKRFSTFYRASYFMPMVASLVASSVVWQFIYQPRFGILNNTLFTVASVLRLPPPPEIGWLTTSQMAMNSVILMSFWKYLGFRMVIFLAGLQSIPDTYYEAAQLDGAGRWRQFRDITFPLLRPTLVFVLVIGMMNSLQTFGQMFIMTDGGPMNATLTVVFLVYRKAFELFRFGYAAAASFILFGIILILTLAQIKLMPTRWEY